ncbi:hypothetical protein QR98_0098380 [Sarcoptes scabiei]|uniref:Uncharacterized protein n=1 Tax=Sarcoptes scabiei TaxID=52283 RepID=A0A132AJS5_SARSC|nr:hypothetical protein QR98_0098380 [Sarcoptes scabiei]
MECLNSNPKLKLYTKGPNVNQELSTASKTIGLSRPIISDRNETNLIELIINIIQIRSQITKSYSVLLEVDKEKAQAIEFLDHLKIYQVYLRINLK